MPNPILRITDGTDAVNLIDGGTGFHLSEWTPSIIQPKSGGMFSNSPMADGRQLQFRVWDNAIETMQLVVNNREQDTLIRDTQTLRRLLLKAHAYWISQGELGGMVWLEKRASCETNTSYALIHDWRTPKDDNPFSPPFMAGNLVAIDEFTLVLERGHWLENPPGTGTCVQTSGLGSWYYWGANQLENPGFETAGGGGADVFASWGEQAGDGTIAQNATSHSGSWCALLTAGPTLNTGVYQAQAGLTAGSTATIGFWTRGSGTVAGRYAVYNVTGAAYILGLTSTGVTGSTYTFVSYSFTLPVGCTEVRVEFWCPATNGQAARFDDATLRIRGNAWTPGQAATCAGDVYVVNKQVIAQLTDVFRYDSSAGTYTQILGTALPYNLFPPDPPLNDILYFMIDASVPNSGPFSNLVFDIGTAQVNITTVVWEYWSGAAWAALTVEDRTQIFTNGFGSAPVNSVSWLQPIDWAVNTVNGINGWTVRATITATGGAVTIPTQQNRDIYTATWGSFLVDDGQVGGDIAALRRLDYRHTMGGTITDARNYRMISGLRSISRGADFQAYINLSDRQNPSFITVSEAFASLSIVDNVLSPSARAIRYIGTAVGSDARIDISISSSYAMHWSGIYRAFMRYNWTGAGSTSDICKVKLGYRLGSGTTFYYSPVSFSFPDVITYSGTAIYLLADMGIFSPSLERLVANDTIIDLDIFVYMIGTGVFTVPVDFIDLVLIPADESICESVTQSRTQNPSAGPLLNSTYYLSLDSIDPPLTILRCPLKVPNSDEIHGYWIPINSAETILQPNVDQRVWALPISSGLYDAATYEIERNQSYPEDLYRLQAFRNQRYLGMRGNR